MTSKKKTSAGKGQGQGLDVLAKKIEELEGELVAARDEADRLKDLAARAQADLQNAKIRMEKQADESRSFAVSGLLERLLPTIDNFQRSFEHLPEDLKDHEWIKGVQATEQALMSDLQAVGLKKIDCLGKTADPAHCEILQVGPGEKDTVVQILEDGYELHDKVLRPAKVVVGNGD